MATISLIPTSQCLPITVSENSFAPKSLPRKLLKKNKVYTEKALAFLSEADT
jgi:hypothetical protein